MFVVWLQIHVHLFWIRAHSRRITVIAELARLWTAVGLVAPWVQPAPAIAFGIAFSGQ